MVCLLYIEAFTRTLPVTFIFSRAIPFIKMKIEFCPSCAGIDIKKPATGGSECARCKYVGEMKEGGMDEINSYKKSLKAGVTPVIPGKAAGPSNRVTNSELRDRLAALKGKSSGDVEFL